MMRITEASIKSVLVKVTARCNLNCDYCYVFNHVDQSWKHLPGKMTEEVATDLAKRVNEYVTEKGIKEFLFVFHGGEPLLLGSPTITRYVQLFRRHINPEVKLDFSLQTNGVLLKENDLEIFEKENIGVSVSIDGPKEVHDLHRLSHGGQSTFEKTMRGLRLLKNYPSIFNGVIAVIDPRADPALILEFFAELDPPSLDFLLPDANYDRLPFMRSTDPEIYVHWLHKAFDVWIENYPHLRIRLFDSVCECCLGGVSRTDAFGFGDVSLLSIETDGSYHDSDIFKTTADGFSHLKTNLKDHSFQDALRSSQILAHRKLLQMEGLSDTCQMCEVVSLCGGGCVQHRYSSQNGFNNPSIYCKELFSFFKHVKSKLESLILESNETIEKEKELSVNVLEYNRCSPHTPAFSMVHRNWKNIHLTNFLTVLEWLCENNKDIVPLKKKMKSFSLHIQENIATFPSVILWTHVGLQKKENLILYDLDDHAIEHDPLYIKYILDHYSKISDFSIHDCDPWLRHPFGNSILFESEPEIIQEGKILTEQALDLIQRYNPDLYEEMRLISPAIQFVVDPTAHPEKLVSFSDDTIPGCLYICIRHKNGFASVADIADSFIHEHRHQKLYVFEKYAPVVLENMPYVKSPWREELRPVSGLFHAVFVFCELTKFWIWLVENKNTGVEKVATYTINQNLEKLNLAFTTLQETKLSAAGFSLLQDMKNQMEDVTTYAYHPQEQAC